MPYFTLTVTGGGPIIDALVYVSPERGQALQKASKVVPPPVQIRALIDTGASCTCIDPTVLNSLALVPTGLVPVHTPSTNSSTPHMANQYDVLIVIPSRVGSVPFLSGTIPVLDADLAHQGIQALIGRDILSQCLFVFDGREGIFSLAF